jgi:hypothetical protein
MRYYGLQNEVKAYLNRLEKETSIQITTSIAKTLNDRVESLKKSGIWSRYGLGFNDSDADSYFQRASVNDALGRAEVCLFTRGVKSLGIWQNMSFWPLRNYQNAGTGSTAYNLGGLGIFDGSLINSPTWGVNGLNFVRTNTQYMTTTLGVAGLRKFTAMVATEPGAYGSLDTVISAWGTTSYFVFRRSAATQLEFIISSSGTQRLYINNVASNYRVRGWGTQNGVSITTESGNQISGPLTYVPDQTGAQNLNIGILITPNNSPYNGVIGWTMFTKDSELSNAQQLLVYNLYKLTLGSNLGLP